MTAVAESYDYDLGPYASRTRRYWSFDRWTLIITGVVGFAILIGPQLANGFAGIRGAIANDPAPYSALLIVIDFGASLALLILPGYLGIIYRGGHPDHIGIGPAGITLQYGPGKTRIYSWEDPGLNLEVFDFTGSGGDPLLKASFRQGLGTPIVVPPEVIRLIIREAGSRGLDVREEGREAGQPGGPPRLIVTRVRSRQPG